MTYRIGEFAARLGLSADTLRYYEKEGLLAPHRDANGQRDYTEEDVAWLLFLLHLKGTGMTMAQLRRYVRLRAQGDATIAARLALLQDVQEEAQAQLRALQHNLTVLDDKVAWYQGRLDGSVAASESFAAYLQRIAHTED
ncbi:MerR family transcriptional regulator [Lacticaseibacillus kribbianus]|uniref:MerR family transcriptional regulator n=1 Tax=Lacticaseibacillus kribbianus TaxID=2926292 RepID=UPI001CD37B45|nr:MerR family transcriptional regulator [Lacticaseibacillus kribbianus]